MIKFAFKSAITFAILILVGYFAWNYIYPRLSKYELNQQSQVDLVRRVIDGDTFEISEREENGKFQSDKVPNLKVRILGIDTPEKYESSKLDRDSERTKMDKKTIKKLGELATDYTRRLIEGKNVTLIPEQNHDDKDKYGRLLRYVYLEDGTFVNKKIIEDGYAVAYRKFGISKLQELIKAEGEARNQKRGLWGSIEGLRQFEADSSDSKIPKKQKKRR